MKCGPHTGLRAIFSAQSGSLASHGPAKSQLLIFHVRDRFLKFRITYPIGHAESAERQIDNFYPPVSVAEPLKLSGVTAMRASHPNFGAWRVIRAG